MKTTDCPCTACKPREIDPYVRGRGARKKNRATISDVCQDTEGNQIKLKNIRTVVIGNAQRTSREDILRETKHHRAQTLAFRPSVLVYSRNPTSQV